MNTKTKYFAFEKARESIMSVTFPVRLSTPARQVQRCKSFDPKNAYERVGQKTKSQIFD